jgi:hypothetical protein
MDGEWVLLWEDDILGRIIRGNDAPFEIHC